MTGFHQVFFVENLTLRTWVGSVFPRLCQARIRGGKDSLRCYLFEYSPLALRFARLSGRILGVKVEVLSFRLLEIRDEQGVLFRLRIPSHDLLEIQRDVMERPGFQRMLRVQPNAWRLTPYLAKGMVSASLLEPRTLWRVLQTIQVCLWKVKREGYSVSAPLLFLERRPWMDSISRYALRQGVRVVAVGRAFRIAESVRRILRPEHLNRLRSLRHPAVKSLSHGSGPRIAVEYYGNLHLNEPGCTSDLPFWGISPIAGRDLVVLFDTASDPLDERKLSELRQNGVEGLAISPRAAASPEAPLFRFRNRGRLSHDRRNPNAASPSLSQLSELESRWMKEQLGRYRFLQAFWGEIFRSQNARIFVSWFKYTQVHCAIADAMQETGGITAIYQRAFESMPSADLTAGADILFGYSPFGAHVERGSRSLFRYHLATGYLGDHRFPILRERALGIRRRLQQRGARRIVAFADENSVEDARWHSGNELQREHYAFLLEKLLEEPGLGLVIKPKVPQTLRARLGPVARLLSQAEATGRCILFEEGTICSATPPAAAALCADLMIHGHLCAVTAGLEAALAGVPTLLLDREGWPTSPLYRLGVGRVIFHDWPSLWKACLEHWDRPSGLPGLGDWSLLLPEMDPFRDGKAALRMGTVLQWLLEGFRAGLDRERVMADAAERYAAAWGRDKVTEAGSEPGADSPLQPAGAGGSATTRPGEAGGPSGAASVSGSRAAGGAEAARSR
ncbi:MAG: hypothetical protein HYZ93_02105 [Candidatus Omnitrophica bacterium]|nr:hypothetical protein [Candidatus Omnitrophota bacterium]